MENIEESLAEDQEKEPVQISSEEWETYANMDVHEPEFLDWISEKGIEMDSGEIPVIVDGKRKLMDTSRTDFGTVKE